MRWACNPPSHVSVETACCTTRLDPFESIPNHLHPFTLFQSLMRCLSHIFPVQVVLSTVLWLIVMCALLLTNVNNVFYSISGLILTVSRYPRYFIKIHGWWVFSMHMSFLMYESIGIGHAIIITDPIEIALLSQLLSIFFQKFIFILHDSIR